VKRADSVPVLTSSYRAGDLISDANERRGDPFDLKPYHPSDGIKKILWKVYAKTGELISRHPEQSMTPEGQVFIFSVNNVEDDHVCGAALDYTKKLEDLSLDVFSGL